MKDKYFFIIIGIYVFFSIILFDPKQDTGGDNAIYLSLGKSIISLNDTGISINLMNLYIHNIHQDIHSYYQHYFFSQNHKIQFLSNF
jgi:hypothetical protein